MNEEMDQDLVAEVEASFVEVEEGEGLDIDSEVTVHLTLPEDWPVGEIMRLRGAVSSAGPMLADGILDLTKNASGDVRLDLAFTVFSMAGQQALEAAKVSLDTWLEDHGAPLVSTYPVQSSNVEALGWHLGVAVAEFRGGGVYAYFDVPESVFMEWWGAPSIGGFLAAEIKPHYRFERLA